MKRSSHGVPAEVEKVFETCSPLENERISKLDPQNGTHKIAIDWYCLIPPKWVPFNDPF